MQQNAILSADKHFRVITLPRMNCEPAREKRGESVRASVMLAMERDYRKRLICDRINFLCKQGV